MVGINDVAALAGVSSATVSRALSGRGAVSAATRERVERAAEELAYVISSDASSLASGRTRNIGVIVPYLGRWYYTEVLSGVQSVLVSQGFDLTLFNLGGDAGERRQIFEQFLFRRRVDAAIAVSVEVDDDEISRLHALRKPVVCVGGPIEGLRTLGIDDLDAAHRVVEHLTALGHRRIAHVAGLPGLRDFRMPMNRQHGYEQALRDVGVEPDPALTRTADFSVRGGHAAARSLLEDPATRPTAVFASSDEMAFGVLIAARELGLSVPGDLSVAGFDDHENAGIVGLTTIAQDPQQMGRRAAELVLAQVESPDEPAHSMNLVMPTRFVERTTTAPPRA
jgi:LacI family transcriptional regulator, repressor for deo operon, udp, cdd, tsx, nupC, and nupG